MRIGPFTIHRHRKNAAGLEIYPWQALTTDRLTPEVRQIVAKMARSECRSFLEEIRETWPPHVLADHNVSSWNPCNESHMCRRGETVPYCQKSCFQCMDSLVQPCDGPHNRVKDAE